MTKIGYEYIIQRIKDRTVEVPKGYSCDELTDWLNGYTKCQKDILEILKEILEEQNK